MSNTARSLFISFAGGVSVLATYWHGLIGVAVILALNAIAPWRYEP